MELVFETQPISQLRPRFARRGRGVITYDVPKVQAYKRMIHAQALSLMAEKGLKPLQGPIALSIWFYRPIQKSVSKVESQRRQDGRTSDTTKPDLDNYIKAFLDACNGALYEDDRQIVDLLTHKRYSDQPKICVEIQQINDLK